MSKFLTLSLTKHWIFPRTFSRAIPFKLPREFLGAMLGSIPSSKLVPFRREILDTITSEILVLFLGAMFSYLPGSILCIVPRTIRSKIPGHFPSTFFGAIFDAMLDVFRVKILVQFFV